MACTFDDQYITAAGEGDVSLLRRCGLPNATIRIAALERALSNQRFGTVRFLCSQPGLNLNTVSKTMVAYTLSDPRVPLDVVQRLIERGVDLTAQDAFGGTAVHSLVGWSMPALSTGAVPFSIQRLQLLVDMGAGVNLYTEDENGHPPDDKPGLASDVRAALLSERSRFEQVCVDALLLVIPVRVLVNLILQYLTG